MIFVNPTYGNGAHANSDVRNKIVQNRFRVISENRHSSARHEENSRVHEFLFILFNGQNDELVTTTEQYICAGKVRAPFPILARFSFNTFICVTGLAISIHTRHVCYRGCQMLQLDS